MGSPVTNQHQTCQFATGNPSRLCARKLTGRQRKWCQEHAPLAKRTNTRRHVAKFRRERDERARRMAYRWAGKTERYFAEARVPVAVRRAALIRYYREALEVKDFRGNWVGLTGRLNHVYVTALVRSQAAQEFSEGQPRAPHPLDFRWVCFSRQPVKIKGSREDDTDPWIPFDTTFFEGLLGSCVASCGGCDSEHAAFGIILPLKRGFAVQWQRRPIVDGMPEIPRGELPRTPVTEEWPMWACKQMLGRCESVNVDTWMMNERTWRMSKKTM